MNQPTAFGADDDETLAVPGVVCVTPTPSGRKVIHAGASAGWTIPRGIMGWEHEIAYVPRADATRLATALKAPPQDCTLPPLAPRPSTPDSGLHGRKRAAFRATGRGSKEKR